LPLSCGPVINAVLPSADSETEAPCRAAPIAPVPTSLLPCWVQVVPERVNTQAAPALTLSPTPPISAVLPSADSATALPCGALPTGPVPTSLLPSWVQVAPERVNTQTAPALPLSW